ncbi:hypothetical protein P4233_00960 [Pseudomonas aeruginosa]|nr:hypothetical protein [Pseudomonas aeruginosa]
MPISNNQGSAPAKGAILAGYFLDWERLANLREQMQADLQPMPNTPPTPPGSRCAAAAAVPTTRPCSAHGGSSANMSSRSRCST